MAIKRKVPETKKVISKKKAVSQKKEANQKKEIDQKKEISKVKDTNIKEKKMSRIAQATIFFKEGKLTIDEIAEKTGCKKNTLQSVKSRLKKQGILA